MCHVDTFQRFYALRENLEDEEREREKHVAALERETWLLVSVCSYEDAVECLQNIK